MEKINKSRKFLSGFGNTNIIEDIYVGDMKKLSPGTIVSENDEQYKIELGIPFMNEKDVQVVVNNDKLIIDGEKRIRSSNERKKRKYKGIFELPADVLVRDLDVKFKQGLLNITLPKKRIVKQFQTSRNS
jgi:HSP20 family protein